ncbi:N,N'-diacetylbacillosaminyl-diphospho-undecaprenol alpha-1,3-N-acetylgalactosaminyltransferase [Hippea sp. KM1]|uniref:N, N'-diacetylbacillosaminyl-diphospho-undecaprenol alpha-1,3-N-acetylgalactosaminyltransferase n=1 Tax=Hippea sp. KM1 TaxID=944481 RepID=UPI00046D39A4|nr:N,N'-diacetylbacillosaminyl-diphospho-undecaprenol alpha-1,3-N-acetylgalactosaminyltransferase [Hippea sp. KM1]
MKIAFLSHLDLNLYLFRLPIMKELVKKGHRVYAIAPKGEFLEKFLECGITPVNYEIERQSLNPFKELKTLKLIRSIVHDISPDILHTFMHKPNIYGNLTGAKNIVNTITGLGSFFIHDDIKSVGVRVLIEALYKCTSSRTKRIVFQNRDDLDHFVNKGIIPEEKAVLIKGSGIDTKAFEPMPKNKKLIKELGLGDKPVVLMVARVIRDKGVEEYIKAAELLKDRAYFLYAGEIDRGNKNAFIPGWKNINYLGFRSDIKELLSICDIFVLPSYREGIPRTLLEAASMEKPIVTTDTVGCKEVVDNGVNGFLVPVKDSKALAEKIEFLIDNPEIRKEFGKRGREKVLKEFDVKIVVEQYLRLYNEILD